MTRKSPSIPAPELVAKEKSSYITQIRKYKVITPLYGGGEEPAKADTITVVRATEVRGHLRFWWRATRSGAFNGNLERMKRREEEIWGSSGEKGKPGPSQVSVRVVSAQRGSLINSIEVLDKRKGKIRVEIGEPRSPWSYAAFPLRAVRDEQTGKRQQAGSILLDVSFNLEIQYPATLKNDVEASLWAWETFGGIGARTRRGFGALQCIKGANAPASSPENTHRQIQESLNKFVVAGNRPRGVPHLVHKLKFKIIQHSDPMSAWQSLFQALKDFRQSRFPDRNGRPYGRSKWPEPDAIRRLPGMTSASKHRTPRSTLDRFPRGNFGLPIIFQFKDEGDPEVTTLQGLNHDRLASPLILRPIACSHGAVALAAILEWEPLKAEDEPYTPPDGLVLKSPTKDYDVKSNLTKAEAADIPPLEGQPDVLQAFLDFLK